MIKRSTWLALTAVLAMVLAACGGDDGGEVRDLGADGTATGSGSASGSASGSGSASASGSATGSTMATPGDGGYEYASNVSAHRLVTLDVCEVKDLLDQEPIDYAAIETIYVAGENSVNDDGSLRSLGGFATAEGRLHGLDDYYGTATPLDDFVSEAIAGDGMFAGVSNGVRSQAIEKGTQNQIMVAWVVHELNTALTKAGDGDFDPASGAVHNWDEAWAFYHGAEPDCAPYATANGRASNFGTQGSDGETAQANEQILAAMIAGRDALLASDAGGAESAAEEIRQAFFITYSQAAIRYATLVPGDVEAGDADTAAAHQAEGLAFWRVIEPWA
ncbi:MAG: FEA1-related lipoprotein, partial [Acidimicrobiia bacterium]